MPQNYTLSVGFSMVISGCVCFPTVYALLHWVFIAAWGLSLGATLRGRGQPSHLGGVPCFKAQTPGVQASVAAENTLSSCGSQVLVALQHVESSHIRD